MPIFEYVALDKSGKQARGRVDAESIADARRRLRTDRVHVVSLEESADVAGRKTQSVAEIRFKRISGRDLATATRQLATLLHAGMALVPALNALVEQLADEPLGRVMARVRDRVNEGAALAAAFQEHPRVFSDLYVNMVSAGEASGGLESILLRLADLSEKRVNLMNRVRAALAYPALMALVGTGVIIFLMTFVIPNIASLFRGLNRDLPWPTVALMALSGFIRDYRFVLLGGVAGVVIGARIWTRTEAGARLWDRAVLRTPLFGDLVLKLNVSRFARTLGTLLGAGVPILDALSIVRRVVGNRVIERAVEDAQKGVGGGESIIQPLRRSGVFPPIVFHMMSAGEASGNLEEGLLRVADMYDSEAESKVEALTSLLEPVMILIMGAVVGFIVLAILLPIFDINQAIR